MLAAVQISLSGSMGSADASGYLPAFDRALGLSVDRRP